MATGQLTFVPMYELLVGAEIMEAAERIVSITNPAAPAVRRVALSSFRQLYDLLGDCVSGRGNWPVRMLEGHQGHLESRRPGGGRSRGQTCGLASSA